MDARMIYETWAPPEGIWSPWVKPVLFAQLPTAGDRPAIETPPAEARHDVSRFFQPVDDRPVVEIPAMPLPPGVPKADGVALVVDLPALQALGLGLELARAGYRPVPLFNACPVTGGLDVIVPREIVSVTPLLSALPQGAERLKSSALPGNAPPAFLLDADRLGPDKPIAPGWFDNRWVVFGTDFPSARVLVDRQIQAVQVIHQGPLQEDLLDVLRGWRRHGIALTHNDVQRHGPPSALVVPPTWRLGLSRLARRVWALLTLRRNRRGGYGGFVPEPVRSGG